MNNYHKGTLLFKKEPEEITTASTNMSESSDEDDDCFIEVEPSKPIAEEDDLFADVFSNAENHKMLDKIFAE